MAGFCIPSRELLPKIRVHCSCALKWWSYSKTAAKVCVNSSSTWLNSCFIIRNEKRINKFFRGPLYGTLVTLSGRGKVGSKSWKLQVNHSSNLVLVSFSKNLALLHPNGWGLRVLSWYSKSYLTSNINCILPISNSDSLRRSALHGFGKLSILQKFQQEICERFLCLIITAWIVTREQNVA